VPLNGTDQFHAFIQLADGETDPIMAPSLLAIVNPHATPQTQQIGITYATPTSVTSNTFQTGGLYPGTTTVTATGYVWNHSNAGSAYIDLNYPDAAGDCTTPGAHVATGGAYGLVTGGSGNTQVAATFQNLFPDVAYCWRLRASIGGSEYDGNWQYFITAGNYHPNWVPNEPAAAVPTTVPQCQSNGAGCATSNCATGSACNQTGSVAGAAHVLTVTRAGTGSGSVASGASNGASIACPSTCSQTYPTGAHAQSVTLTATPAAGSRFTGWSGGGCSGTGACTVSMSADQAVTATFTLIPKQPPPPPPAPRCTLGARSASVRLHAHKRSQRASVGVITFSARCDQATNATLSAVLTETLGRKHGKLQFKTFRLGPRHLSLAANVSRTVSFKLAAAALAGLSQHHSERLVATLSASNAHGSTRAALTIKKLQGRS
jgi:hypothetical protein